ncbi:phosphoenolpyruvate carboxylase [Anopheles sinensis]|uniref:Phosphoenolpyruvate carboxylase n=1 Tax=Anopheles sinensis TaxID=74873 RepID=A0A084VR41_ANOSI|nr:phosphoenolpyruvate carboxylase [Anopheles sinensis]
MGDEVQCTCPIVPVEVRMLIHIKPRIVEAVAPEHPSRAATITPAGPLSGLRKVDAGLMYRAGVKKKKNISVDHRSPTCGGPPE